MRLSRLASSSKRWKDTKFGNSRARKKHKRLDAICEKAYNRNHGAVKDDLSEFNVGGGSVGNESELRRSTRVRRVPLLLDASPPPPKKRRKIDKRSGVASVDRVKKEDSANREALCSTSRDVEEEPSSWRFRLRSRAKNVTFGRRERGDFLPRGKRKLFGDLDGLKEDSKLEVGQLDDKKGGLEGGKLTVVKSKRPGRIKASNISRNEHLEIEPENIIKADQEEKNEMEVLEVKDYNDIVLSKSEMGFGNNGVVKDCNAATQLVEKQQSEAQGGLELEYCTRSNSVQPVELADQLEQPGCVMEGEKQWDAVEVEVSGVPSNQVEDGRHDRPLENENSNVDKMKGASIARRYKPRIKEGRQCGLCGGGTDGKTPKKLVQDEAGSDNEAYSGSSASDEPNYDIWDGFGDEPGWLGHLLGPVNDRFGIAGVWVHQHCAVWSPEVYFAGLGCLKNVRAALCRGRVLKCSRCGRPGATIGCRVDRCPKTYHLPCARAEGCIFDHRKFLIACTDHRHLFQPHGSHYLHRLKKMKAKKVKLGMRKMSNDVSRKDLEAEEKWLENCGEDEEFLKRESKRLHRDLLRIAPVYIGGSNSKCEIQFQGWESVAGLQDVIQCLKEVVILPLLYPEFFSNLGLMPPRGVLLHGYPGTGKTLVVRALIGSCARGDKRIAYFARKGADCLGKYVGDAERQLRLLFQVAEKSQPSIIFFDEIDGLAPCRSRQQDQTHNSVVSTLLALLDGLKSRGSVVVIGATNRPDAIDPALRRPGRFDREIYFPLPSVKDREAIVSLHTQKWPKPVTGSLLKWIARRTVGFAGADLQALCTQAAMIALKRSCPLQELLSTAGEKTSRGKRPSLPNFSVEERDWFEALSCVPPPCSRREAGMAANDVVSSPLQAHLIPCLVQPLSRLLVSFCLDERLWLPPPLFKAVMLIKNVIVTALDKKNMQSDYWWSHVHGLLQEADVASEIERALSRASILVGDASCFGTLDDDTDDDSLRFDPSKIQHRVSCASLRQNASGNNSGFRILISGNPRSGPRYLASCLLHCFVGNVEIQKVDLATISLEGRGDMVQGVTQILMKCASVGSCMIFMPRIDLWAVETYYQVCEKESDSPLTNVDLAEVNESCLTHSEVASKENKFFSRVCKSAEMAETQNAAQKASYLWSSFTEQVESICVSTSLMILATSEVPFSILPLRIRQFFKSDTLKCSLSTSLEDTVARFSVQVDGNFDHDMVIDSSAAKLSKDLAQQFIQFIHHRNHSRVSSYKEYKTCDTVEGDADTICPKLDPGSAIEQGSKEQYSVTPVMSAPLLCKSRNVRGKSSLLITISTFGYQILRYPHFAELCWVTSKLKEGPSADINGPWKGWPFNSCIVRPNTSLEKVVVSCSSSSVRSKEKSGLVRGLIAVGLSAYRGVYTSLREVSCEVRKVLELLAERIHAKVQSGKDRYRFIRLLSQVAYLEDMVNSWAYTLRSLEVDAQLPDANLNMPFVGSLDDYKACKDNHVHGDEYKSSVPNRSLHEPEVLEESTEGFHAKDNGRIDVKESDFCHLNAEERVAVKELGHSAQMVLHRDAPVAHFQSCAADPLGVKHLSVPNGVTLETCRSEDSGIHSKVQDLRSLEHSNGFVHIDSADWSKDGPCGSDDFGGVKLSSIRKECNRNADLPLAGISIPSEDGNSNSDGHRDTNLSSNQSADLSTDFGVVCSYHFCPGCLFNLHHLMQKIISYQWELKGSDLTVDDVHDVVTSLSVNLHSAVGKFCLDESSSNSFDPNRICDIHTKLFEGQETGLCQCKNSGNRLVTAMECSCHSRCEIVTAKAKSSWNLRHGVDSKLIYREGVLASVDSEKDVSFHCKFETLCLCSLIEWIVMTMQPLN